MAIRKIGATVTTFNMSFDKVLPLAKELGLDGLQLMNAGGEHDVRSLSTDDRKRLADRIRSFGLEVTALRSNVVTEDHFDALADGLARAKACVDMACDMDVEVVTGCLGNINPDVNDPIRIEQTKALTELSLYAADKGRYYAGETMEASLHLMRDFLNVIPGRAIRLNYDPANLVGNGIDSVRGVHIANGLIVHTHVKDAVRRPDGTSAEAAPGEGGVPFKAWIGALDAIGYDGFLTIERESGNDRIGDIRKFIEIVRSA